MNAPVPTPTRLGLVLEGGGMRALFTAGVLDALHNAGIRFDGIIGVSAGAAFGCNWKSHQPGRALRYNVRCCRDSRYGSLRSLLRTGDLFDAEFCYRTLPRTLDPFDSAAFEADPTRFWVVATDADTGEAVCPEITVADDTAFDWFRASASMPIVSRPVPIGNRRYLDGGIADPIPLGRFESMGFSRNLVILTQPATYRKKSSRILLPILSRLSLRHLPAVVTALAARPAVYNRALDHVAARVAAGAAFVIRPDAPLPVGRTSRSPDALRLTHSLGRAAALHALPALLSWISPT